MKKKLNIGVIGYSGSITKDPVKSLVTLSYNIGKSIAKNGNVLYNGGRDGIMDCVSEGASSVNGEVIGVLPWEDEGNKYLTQTIKTGLDFSMRSFVMVKSCDIIVSIGGEIGTAIEILAAYANKKPVILFKNTGGWTDRIVSDLIDGYYLDNRKTEKVYQVSTIEEMEILIDKLGSGING